MLTMQDKIEIVKLRSTTTQTQDEIGQQFGISGRRVGQVEREYKDVVDQATHELLLNALKSATGTSIVDQAWRMLQYERDVLKLDHINSPDAINARTRIMGQVAKETGQIAPTQTNITGTVSHIIGINPTKWQAAQLQLESPADALEGCGDLVLTESSFEEISDGSA